MVRSCCLLPEHEFHFMLINHMQQDRVLSNPLESFSSTQTCPLLIAPLTTSSPPLTTSSPPPTNKPGTSRLPIHSPQTHRLYGLLILSIARAQISSHAHQSHATRSCLIQSTQIMRCTHRRYQSHHAQPSGNSEHSGYWIVRS
jgi:hypothetical protein